jgi:sulfonate transport system substrate-binding protein
MMAAAEVESGAKLFNRKPEDNTWGILNVREAFANENPALVKKVLAAYEQARAIALANPAEVRKALVDATKLSDAVIERQLTRTELTHSTIGQAQIDGITAAGLALKEAGVLPASTDVKAAVDALLDRRFAATN